MIIIIIHTFLSRCKFVTSEMAVVTDDNVIICTFWLDTNYNILHTGELNRGDADTLLKCSVNYVSHRHEHYVDVRNIS